MDKGEFNISVYDQNKNPTALSVTGYVSTIYGIHNDGSSWVVSHSPTGLFMSKFRLLKDAKRFVKFFEKFDFNFGEFGKPLHGEKYETVSKALQDWIVQESKC